MTSIRELRRRFWVKHFKRGGLSEADLLQRHSVGDEIFAKMRKTKPKTQRPGDNRPKSKRPAVTLPKLPWQT